MDKQKGKSKNKKEKILKIVKRETQVLKAIINQTRSIGNEFLVINIKAGIEAGRDAGPGLHSALLACRTKRKTNNSFNQRNPPNYNPGPAPWNRKLCKQHQSGKRNSRGLYFLLIYSLVDPTAVQRGGRHCCPGGIGTKNSS